jgi:lipopolysaccharide export LptBFGC system permease protein LptF
MSYAYLTVATFCLWNLGQTRQMIALKSIGKSPRQILRPFFCCAAFIATFWILVVHPIGVFLEEFYNKNLGKDTEINTNIWINDTLHNRVIFLKTISGNNVENLCIFEEGSKTFTEQAIIGKNTWKLKNITQINNNEISSVEEIEIPKVLSSNLIRLLVKPPNRQDVYSLRKIYKIKKLDNIVLKLYELEFHKLLANCFSFILFALIAAAVCFSVNRFKTKTSITIQVVFSAIFFRFSSNLLEALAYSGAIPIEMACWTVPIIFACIFLSLLIWREG